jgi:hypothetical protein
MFGRWRMVCADRRRWSKARTWPELAGLMEGWLMGEVSCWPGYAAAGPDPETAHLIPTLVRLNQAGMLTDQSQPGCDEDSPYGRWTQHAAVSGLVLDRRLRDCLAGLSAVDGLLALVSNPHGTRTSGLTVTTVDGKPHTGMGAHLSRRSLYRIWRGVHREALDAIHVAWQVTLIDLEPGRDDRLWPAIHAALDEHCATAHYCGSAHADGWRAMPKSEA